MRLDRARLALILALAAAIVPARMAPASSESDMAEARQKDDNPCDGKARLRGPVFHPKSGNIMPEALVALDVVAETIKKSCSGRTIVIEGHTDTLGDPGYNQRLSEVRAREIKRLLVERGVPAEQLETVGYGATRALTSDPALQDLNRRISFVMKGKASAPAP